MDTPVLVWWATLTCVGAFNIALWLATARIMRRHARGSDPSQRAWATSAPCRMQLLLSAGYVLGCAYRSFLPVFDVQRLSMVDSWLASVIVGRCVATIAELCFVAQWALLLGEVAKRAGNAPALAVARALVPLIVVAETCSWYSVLTTNNLGHVVEESLWGLSAALVAASALALRPRSAAALRPALSFFCAAGLVYAAYMFAVDVPMYAGRWLADETSGRAYLSVPQGVVDAAVRRVVSHRWEDWRSEVVWMSLYFSVAVWLSIGLVHVRVDRARGEAHVRSSGTRRGVVGAAQVLR